MADVNAIINIDINSSSALTNLKRLESQIDQFNRSVATSNATAAASQQSLNKALIDGINNTGLFTSRIVPVESSMTRFSRSLDEGRLSLGEYSRHAASQMPGLSRLFRREFDTIEQVATSRVKSMQTQYLALGKTVDGVTRTIASTPIGLGKGIATDLAITQQRQQMFNKLLDDGSTKLLNWGKNTQWAGRQLMVGFTLPLAAFGAAASKTFMEIDKATISLKRVYGDLSTTKEELDSNVEAVKGLGKEYTKYGITLSETIALSARAAATGATNEALMAATEQTLRFATLGQMDYNQALDTTISLQTAFAISNEDLGKTVDYLNAVENQTILTMEDMSLAIPRVATVVKGLGGSVEDLAIMMTAMREGGVSAENAANGLKSGLASLINPTDRASESLAKMGINLNSIIKQNKGDLMGIITEFGTAINRLDGFSRQQVLEKVFGKYQYARMSALFTNITKDAGQAARAMDIAGMSAEQLASISEKELGQISESTSVKFQAAMEQLKISIAPIGEAFLKGITPIVNMVSKIADAFNNLPDGVKNAMAVITAVVAGLGPVILMTIGLLGNGFANIIKTVQFFRKSIAGIKGDASAFTWLAQGELEAVTATKALEGSAVTLTDKLLLQRGAVAGLTAEYERFTRAAGIARAEMGSMGGAPVPSGGGRPPVPTPRLRRNTGGTIPGVGSTDTVPAMLTPGEFVINKQATAQNLPLLHAINDGQAVGGFNKGGQIPGVQYFGGRIKPGGQVERIREKLKSAAEYLPPLPKAKGPSTFLHLIKEQGQGGEAPDIIRALATALGVTPRRMSKVGIDIISGKDINSRLNVAELGGTPSGGHVTKKQFLEAITATQASNKDPFRKIKKLDPNIGQAVEDDLIAWLKNNPTEELNDSMISDVVMGTINNSKITEEARTRFLSTGGYRLSRGIGFSKINEALGRGTIKRAWKEGKRHVAVELEDGTIVSYETRNISTSEGVNQTGGKNYREFDNEASYGEWARAQGREIEPLEFREPLRRNRGGQIPRFNRGGRFLGMPQKFNTKLEKELRESTRLAQSGPGSQLPISEFGALEQGIGGYSAAFPGLNGIYVDAAGRKVVYKSHPNFESAEAEMLSGRLMSSLFGLESPSQVVVKRTHPITGDVVFGVESEFDKKFAISETVEAGSGRQFTPSEAARQFIASGIRRDRDLQPANIRGNIVVDQGVAVTGVNDKGEPRAMAQGRVTTTDPRSVTEQLQVNAIMGKGGAKKFLAENLADIARSVGPEEFERLMVSAVSEARTKLNTSIDNLPTSESTKNMYRSILTKDFDELQATSWRSYYDHLESFTVPVAKQPTEAALKKLELAKQDSARSKASRDMAAHNIVSGRLGLPTAWARGVFRNTGGPIFESQTKIVPGVGSTDTVPAMLTPGEFVINKQATRENLPLLHAINNGQAIKRNKGGQIPGMQYFATPNPQRMVQSQNERHWNPLVENINDSFNYAGTRSVRSGLPLPIAGRRQLVLVDLDDTIMRGPSGSITRDSNPADFKPIQENIDRIKELKSQGIDIEFLTARPPHLEEVTRKTLKLFGLDDVPVTFNDMKQQGKRDKSKMVTMLAPDYKVEVARNRIEQGYDVSLLDDNKENRLRMQQSGIYSFFNKGGQIPGMQYFATPRPQRVVQKPEMPSAKVKPFTPDPALFAPGGAYYGFEEIIVGADEFGVGGVRVLKNLSGDGSTVTLQMGKYHPFHVGHEELLRVGLKKAKTSGSDFVFAASGSYGNQSDNPLNPVMKRGFIEEATGISPNMVSGEFSLNGLYAKLVAPKKERGGGYSRFIESVGSDRVGKYTPLAKKFFGEGNTGSEVLERGEGLSSVSNTSGTMLRQLAMEGNYEEFSRLLPASVSKERKREAYEAIRFYEPFRKRSEPIPEEFRIKGYALGGPVTPMLAAAASNLSRLGFNRLSAEERLILQSQQQASPLGMQLFRGVNAAADLVPEEIRQLALSGNVTDFSQLIGREIATPRGSWSSAFNPAATMLGENSTARRLKELSGMIFPRSQRSSKKTAREILDRERALGDNSPQIKAAKRKLDLAIKEGQSSSYISSLEAEYEKAKQAQRLRVQSLEQAVPEYENLMRSGASSSMIFDLTNVGPSSGIGQGQSLINGITVDKDGVYRVSLHSSGFDTVPVSDISSFGVQERGIGGGNQFNEQEHFMFNKGGQIPQPQHFALGGMAQSLKNKIGDLRTYLNLRHGAAPGVERIPLDPLSQSARDQQRNEDIYGPGIYHSDKYDTPQTYAGIPRPDGSYVYKGSSELGRMYSVSDVPGTIYRTSRNPRALLDFAKGKGFIHIDDIPDIFGSLEQQNLELRKMGYSGIIVPDVGVRGESFIVDLVSGTQSYNALAKTNPDKPFRKSEMERMRAAREKVTQNRNTGGPIFESQSKIVPGVGSTDTVPAMLTPGEFVINKQATSANLSLLHAINNGEMLNRNKGGQIPSVQYFATPNPQRVVQSSEDLIKKQQALQFKNESEIGNWLDGVVQPNIRRLSASGLTKNTGFTELYRGFKMHSGNRESWKKQGFPEDIQDALLMFSQTGDVSHLESVKGRAFAMPMRSWTEDKSIAEMYAHDIRSTRKRTGSPILLTLRDKEGIYGINPYDISGGEQPQSIHYRVARDGSDLIQGQGPQDGGYGGEKEIIPTGDPRKGQSPDSLIVRLGVENDQVVLDVASDLSKREISRLNSELREYEKVRRIQSQRDSPKGDVKISKSWQKLARDESERVEKELQRIRSTPEDEWDGDELEGLSESIYGIMYSKDTAKLRKEGAFPENVNVSKLMRRLNILGKEADLMAEMTGKVYYNRGGQIPQTLKANAGKLIPGVGSTDTVPAMLTPGEFVINKEATQSNLSLLHAINDGNTPQSMQGFNRGGQIPGVQYFTNGGLPQSNDDGYYGAPRQIKAQTRNMPEWSTQSAEKLAAEQAAKAFGATTKQIDNNLNRVAAHLIESQGAIKYWVANNLMTDLQAVNQYMNRVPKVAKTVLNNTDMIAEVARQTGLSSDRVRQELDLLVKKVHPSTIESASVLKHLSELDAQASIAVQNARKRAKLAGTRVPSSKTSFGTNSDTGYLAAMTSATLQERLQGDFYGTLGDRAYVTPEGGYQTYRGGAESIPVPVTEVAPIKPKNISKERAEQINKQAEAEAKSNLRLVPHATFRNGGGFNQDNVLISQETIDAETRRIADELFEKEKEKNRYLAEKERKKAEGDARGRQIAADRKNAVVPVGTQSLPIVPPDFNDDDLNYENQEQPRTEERDGRGRSRRSRIGGGLMKAGGAISMASMLPFMMQNEEGNFLGMNANMLGTGLMVGGMAMPAIGSAISAGGGAGMLGGGALAAAAAAAAVPLAITAAAAAAVGVGLVLWRKNIDENSKETANLTANLGVTANSVEAMGKILNVQSPSQRRQQMQLGLTANQNQIAQQVIPSLQTEEGQKLIEELRVANSEDRYKKLGDYVEAAVATGMMTKKEATVFGKVAAATIGDTVLGSRVAFDANMQEKGSSGMMGIAKERMEALSANDLARQGMASTGEGASISPAAAAAVVGSSLQIVSDLADVIQLAREEYQDGTISVREYREVINEAKNAQELYNKYIINAVSGSQEQGGTRQAIKDQLIVSGKATPEQLDALSYGMNIGSTSPLGLDSAQTTAGIAKIMSEQGDPLNQRNWLQSVNAMGLQFLSSKGMTTDEKMSMPDNFLGSLGSFIFGGVSDLDIETQRKVDQARPIAEEADTLYKQQVESRGLEQKYLNAFNEGQVSLDQIQQFNELLKSGTADAVVALKDLRDNDDVVRAMYASSSRQAGTSESVIEVGLKFKQEGGNIAEYQNFINSLPKEKQIEYAITFSGLNANERIKELKDIETMSARIGKENAAMFGGSKFYTTAIENRETQPLLKQTRKAEKAGVGESYGTIVAGIVTNDNGKQITVSEFLSLSESTIKALKKWSDSDEKAKKSIFLSLQTAFEGPDGKRISAQEASAIYDELVDEFGKERITRLPDDVISKVVVLNMQIQGLEQAEKALLASEVLANAMTGDIPTGPQRAELQRLAAIRKALNNAKAVRDSLISDADLTPKGGRGGGGGGGGGAKDNPLLNFRNALLEQIRLYSDIEATLKTLFSKQTSILGILAKKNGMDDKLRAAGLGEPMVQAILGMGSSAANKWYKKNVSGGKLNEAGLTEQRVARGVLATGTESEAVRGIRQMSAQQNASDLLSNGPASLMTSSMISSDAGLSDMYIGAIKEVTDAENKLFSARKKGIGVKEAKDEYNQATKSLSNFIKKLNEYNLKNVVTNKLLEARAALQENTIKRDAKALLEKDSTISKDLRDVISGDAELSLTYTDLLARKNSSAEAAKVGGPGSKKRKQQAEKDAKKYNDFMESTVLRLGDPNEKVLRDKLELATKSKEKTNKMYKQQTDPLLEQIDLINRQIASIQELNNADQNRIRDLNREKEILERQVEVINRKNEKDQLNIDKLQREDELRTRVADSLNHELSIMSQQETKIREAYDKRIKALDEVAKINNYIISQQKSQLGLAQALSQGDVYAAAAAQQDMQAGSAQFAQEQVRSGLQTGMENQIEGLTTAGGLTRVQAEDQIRSIGEQTYQTNLLIRDLQDVIYARNLDIAAIRLQERDISDNILKIQDDIYKRDTEIIGIQTQKLDPLQKQLTAIQDQKIATDKVADAQIDAAQVDLDNFLIGDLRINQINDLANAWIRVAGIISKTNEIFKSKSSELGEMPAPAPATATEAEKKIAQDKITSWKNKYAKLEAERDNAKAKAKAEADAIYNAPKMATGGVVGIGARDSVAAMLTPGEFVMRKASVQKYGTAMFERMNMGAFEMPRYNTQEVGTTTVKPTSNTANINAPVYNTYSINVPVTQPNASANDIANIVMTKIKNVDNSSIRRINGY